MHLLYNFDLDTTNDILKALSQNFRCDVYRKRRDGNQRI